MRKSKNTQKFRANINLETAENLERFKEFQRFLLASGKSLSDYLMLVAKDYKNRHYQLSQAGLLTQSEVLALAKRMRLRLTDSELYYFRVRRFTEGVEFIRREVNGKSRYLYLKTEMVRFFKRLKAKRRAVGKKSVLKKQKENENLPKSKSKKPIIKEEPACTIIPLKSIRYYY